MTDFNIIPLAERPDFVDACAAWSYGEWGSQVPTRNLMQVYDDYKTSLEGVDLPVTWMAVSNDKPVGMVRLKKIDHIEREDLKPWLGSLFVHPKYRGKGIAEALCDHVHHAAKNTYGFEEIYLFTGTAEDLYRKLGYEKIGTVSDRAGISKEKTLMKKTL